MVSSIGVNRGRPADERQRRSGRCSALAATLGPIWILLLTCERYSGLAKASVPPRNDGVQSRAA
ncbi:hypothetical protein KCP69_01445 [Salmonella enterica subsp. enterica]|nr:hypothetical protein KCP69_01445 [Salmonella enterica subsp. enterica]